ncbi:hypothetical protein CAEBREN_01808 [Caenorhabditis brenneri]|uniref:Uncharacterized protein n=1 Tax=Caenorhabditis brenneri TaxID=135651 RepID=G0MYH5_CAEBE|nr:hypothetical protein CAEBREN_01808 [Caenorhabditis brenneri]
MTVESPARCFQISSKTKLRKTTVLMLNLFLVFIRHPSDTDMCDTSTATVNYSSSAGDSLSVLRLSWQDQTKKSSHTFYGREC